MRRILRDNGLSLTLPAVLLVLLAAPALTGQHELNAERIEHGNAPLALPDYLRTGQSSRFWFESFQNWQSEFLAIAAMLLLGIHLRQRGSPEWKPVDGPHSQTGTG